MLPDDEPAPWTFAAVLGATALTSIAGGYALLLTTSVPDRGRKPPAAQAVRAVATGEAEQIARLSFVDPAAIGADDRSPQDGKKAFEGEAANSQGSTRAMVVDRGVVTELALPPVLREADPNVVTLIRAEIPEVRSHDAGITAIITDEVEAGAMTRSATVLKEAVRLTNDPPPAPAAAERSKPADAASDQKRTAKVQKRAPKPTASRQRGESTTRDPLYDWYKD